MSVSSEFELLRRTWSLSDAFFDDHAISDNALASPICLRNPFIFYFGHLPCFAWNTLRGLFSADKLHHTFDTLFSRGIDPDIDNPEKCHDHPPVPSKWPSWSELLRYRDNVRAEIRTCLNAGSDDDRELAYTVRMVAEHEAMHVETLYYMLAQLPRRTKSCCHRNLGPPKWKKAEINHPSETWVEVPGANVPLGTDSNNCFRWDNEEDSSMAPISSFDIARHAVSVGDFLSFVCSGGYYRRDLWNAEDWEYICREEMRHPRSWMCAGEYDMGEDIYVLTAVGPGPRKSEAKARFQEMRDWPASVSLAEARAYARWRGATLPSEAQWLLAAYGTTGATASIGNVQVMTGRPHSVLTGCLSPCSAVGLVGNGWELTTTEFAIFSGFRATKRYPEYSADFFDGKHFVLKGGSWATHNCLMRPSFRNFFQARYPYVFSKFRLVRSGEYGRVCGRHLDR